MYRAVLDTNVFVSGGVISNSYPSQVIDQWRAGTFTLVVSPTLLEEYNEVLFRPQIRKYTGLTVEETRQYISEIEKRSYMTSGILELNILTDDSDDNMVLACAVEGHASHLVTGNQKHFPFKSYQGVTIVTPRKFIDVLEGYKS